MPSLLSMSRYNIQAENMKIGVYAAIFLILSLVGAANAAEQAQSAPAHKETCSAVLRKNRLPAVLMPPNFAATPFRTRFGCSPVGRITVKN